MTALTREEIRESLTVWNEAFYAHDLKGVLDLLHDEIYFENWTGGQVKGIESLKTAWAPWFKDHGGFRFTTEDTLIDEAQQKAVTRWRLDWPSTEAGYEGLRETRRGVDVMRFEDGKVIEKLTYSQTTLEIDGRIVRLRA
ncbi:MAG: nuclear transport factor 2 family protein [Candidatus Bathyarchaeia archaeon]